MSVLPTVLRWFARISGLAIAGAYFFMVVGEWLTPHSGGRATVIEWTGIALMTATCTRNAGGVAVGIAGRGAVASVPAGIHAADPNGPPRGAVRACDSRGTRLAADWLVRTVPALYKSKLLFSGLRSTVPGLGEIGDRGARRAAGWSGNSPAPARSQIWRNIVDAGRAVLFFALDRLLDRRCRGDRATDRDCARGR